MATLFWLDDGLHVKGQARDLPAKTGTSLTHRIMERPINYDASPESMLRTLGASLWVRDGNRWYVENKVETNCFQTIVDQLRIVEDCMRTVKRPLLTAQRVNLTSEEEDLIFSILAEACYQDILLLSDKLIVDTVNWLRRGLSEAKTRWGKDRSLLYETFLLVPKDFDGLIQMYQEKKYPQQAQVRVCIQTNNKRAVLSRIK